MALKIVGQALGEGSAPAAGTTLLPRGPEHAPFLRELWADRPFMHDFHRHAAPLPADDAVLRERLERERGAPLERTRALHWVVAGGDGRPWGLLSLVDIHPQHRRAELLIGVRRGAPFGTAPAAMLLAFELAFARLRLNKLYALIPADNPHSLRGALHLGFREEGRLREHWVDAQAGRAIDVIHAGLLASEAFSPTNERLAARLLGRRG
jgi:RimJ/RimL family protein N-acetyltransferase